MHLKWLMQFWSFLLAKPLKPGPISFAERKRWAADPCLPEAGMGTKVSQSVCALRPHNRIWSVMIPSKWRRSVLAKGL